MAKTSFADAMSGTFAVSAFAVLGSALVAFLLLRDKLTPAAPAATSEDETVAVS
jgi:MFS transporter, DHA2 family, multidrug resistance protein